MTDVHGRSVTMQSISSSLKVRWHMQLLWNSCNLMPVWCLYDVCNMVFLGAVIFHCRKQWIQKTLWRMLSIISIHSINNTLNTALVSDSMALTYISSYVYGFFSVVLCLDIAFKYICACPRLIVIYANCLPHVKNFFVNNNNGTKIVCYFQKSMLCLLNAIYRVSFFHSY